MRLLNLWWLQPLMLLVAVAMVLLNKTGVATGLQSLAIDTPILLVLLLYAAVLMVLTCGTNGCRPCSTWC